MRKRVYGFLCVGIIASTIFILACASGDEDPTADQEYNGELPVLEIGDKWMHKGNFGGIEEVLAIEITGEEIVDGVECYTYAASIDPPVFGAQYMTGIIEKDTLDDIEGHMYGEVGGEPFETSYVSSCEYSDPPYPLTIDHTWTVVATEITEYRIMGETESETEVNESTWAVTGIEEIEVPAGTFRCFRMEKYDDTGSLIQVQWYSDIDKGRSIKEVDYEDDMEFELIGYSVSMNGEKRSGGEPVPSPGDMPSYIPSPFHKRSAGTPEFSLEELSETIDILSILPDSFMESAPGTEMTDAPDILSYSFENDDYSQFMNVQFSILGPMDRTLSIGLLQSDKDTIEDILMAGVFKSDDAEEAGAGFYSMKIEQPDIGEYAAFGEGIRPFKDSFLYYEMLIFVRGNVYVLAVSIFGDEQPPVSMEALGYRIDDMLLGNPPDKIPQNPGNYAY